MTRSSRSDRAAQPEVAAGTPDGPRFAVVGIGASAGGIEALRQLVPLLPSDTGIAFVLIQHLDPTHASLTAEVLGRGARFPIVEAKDGMLLEPNRMFVIPPGGYLAIEGRRLRVLDPVERRGMRVPVDYFFRSLAHGEQERAIGIILSGAGSDGSQGVREIKAAGGMVMVQAPDTAAHDGMPRSAIATGEVDYVLPIADMPDALRHYVRHWYVQRGAGAAPAAEEPDDVRTILGLLRARTKYDFSGYKRGTVERRIQRRMGLSRVEKTGDYIALLRGKPEEILALRKDLLIGVTSFFRDPRAWADLEELVITPLVRGHRGGMPIRAWVAGCATGEEAYSLAMVLLEHCQRLEVPSEVQVFASDIDAAALAVARAGVYTETIAADVPAERLRQFFTRADNAYRVNRTVRESVVFAEQNVITDPPFSRLDLVSCRNLLIYLEPEVQKRVLTLFHFALVEGGYLFVGGSETIAPQPDLFRTLSRSHHIFQRTGAAAAPPLEIPTQRLRTALEPGVAAALAAGGPHRRLATLAQQHLLRRFAPACAVVTARGDVVYLGGGIDPFLQLPEGEPTSDFVSMARSGLRSALRIVLARAAAAGQPASIDDVAFQAPHAGARVRITAETLREPPELAGLVLVRFEPEPAAGADAKAHPAPSPAATSTGHAPDTGEPEAEIHRLEEDLRSTREELQTTIEELATSNEEFRAANEEMVSINEELQSTNEELETSKEELQSLNEEMQTINSQLEFKIGELEALNNDLANLFASTDIATIFLDRALRIRRFTPAATRLLRVIDTDLGRPFTDLARAFSDASLLDDAQQVLADLAPIEREIDGLAGQTYLRRVTPYRTDGDHVDGVVLTFVDITMLKRQARELAQLNESLTARVARGTADVRHLIRSAPNGSLVVDEQGTILEANARAEALLGYGPGELAGRSDVALVPERLRGDARQDWSRLLRVRHEIPDRAGTQTFGRRKDGSEVPIELGVYSMELDDRPVSVLAVRDSSAQRQAELTRIRLDAVVSSSPAAIVLLARDGTITLWNHAAQDLYGARADEAVGRSVAAILPAETAEQFDACVERLERGETIVTMDSTHERRDGSRAEVTIIASAMRDPSGEIDGFCVMAANIAQRREAEQQIAEALDGERQRIGRELHDTLGQQITAIGLLLSTLKVEAPGAPVNPTTLHNLEELVGQVRGQLRMLVKGVFPVAVDSAGLLWALYDLAHETSELFGVLCRVEGDPEVAVPDNFWATELYWIAREAVHNAVHHGRAHEIVITLSGGERIRLSVRDDGAGIAANLDETRTMGLRTMRHRSSIIGGTFRVGPAPGGGTIVTCVCARRPRRPGDVKRG